MGENIISSGIPDGNGTVWYDITGEPFDLYGFCDPKHFLRLPEEVARATSNGVYSHFRMTAGGRVRFSTDSPVIRLKAVLPSLHRMYHMPLTGSSGFDMYTDTPSGYRFRNVLAPVPDSGNEFTAKITLQGGRHERFLTLNFPLYNAVDSVQIGLDEGSSVGHGRKYTDKPPVVYYGSSITQGGCASRPGLSYESIISRELDMDYVNLGFSGSAKGEDAVMDYIASLRMSAFVYDYDHNAPSVEHLRDTHARGYLKVREKNPDLPIVIISRPNKYFTDTYRRRDVILKTYSDARAAGDGHVWYVDGESFFAGRYSNECTVDGTHPNDLGFSLMADVIGDALRRALSGSDAEF